MVRIDFWIDFLRANSGTGGAPPLTRDLLEDLNHTDSMVRLLCARRGEPEAADGQGCCLLLVRRRDLTEQIIETIRDRSVTDPEVIMALIHEQSSVPSLGGGVL